MGGIREMVGVWLGEGRGWVGGREERVTKLVLMSHIINILGVFHPLRIFHFSTRKNYDPLSFGRGSKISYGRGRGLPGYVL